MVLSGLGSRTWRTWIGDVLPDDLVPVDDDSPTVTVSESVRDGAGAGPFLPKCATIGTVFECTRMANALASSVPDERQSAWWRGPIDDSTASAMTPTTPIRTSLCDPASSLELANDSNWDVVGEDEASAPPSDSLLASVDCRVRHGELILGDVGVGILRSLIIFIRTYGRPNGCIERGNKDVYQTISINDGF